MLLCISGSCFTLSMMEVIDDTTTYLQAAGEAGDLVARKTLGELETSNHHDDDKGDSPRCITTYCLFA